MSNFPSLTPKKLVGILMNNGFEFDRAKGSHHIYYNKKRKKLAIIPMHKKDLPKGTLMAILKQAGIDKSSI
jgi:predicted RNA binding protein YcfA (HicA-like mRNA interferase family)